MQSSLEMILMILGVLLFSAAVSRGESVGESVGEAVDRWLEAFFAPIEKIGLFSFLQIITHSSSLIAVLCDEGELEMPKFFREGDVRAVKIFEGAILNATFGFNQTSLSYGHCEFPDRNLTVNGSVTLTGPLADLELKSYLQPSGVCLVSLESISTRPDAQLTVQLDPEARNAIGDQTVIKDMEESFAEATRRGLDDSWKSSVGTVYQVSATMCNVGSVTPNDM